MMMASFANMESIHQHAYSLLFDTVGMPEIEYKAFAEYEQMADKHEYINVFVFICHLFILSKSFVLYLRHTYSIKQ